MNRKPNTKAKTKQAKPPPKSNAEIEAEKAAAILRPIVDAIAKVLGTQTKAVNDLSDNLNTLCDLMRVTHEDVEYANGEISKITEDIAEIRRQAEEVGIENILRRKSACPVKEHFHD